MCSLCSQVRHNLPDRAASAAGGRLCPPVAAVRPAPELVLLGHRCGDLLRVHVRLRADVSSAVHQPPAQVCLAPALERKLRMCVHTQAISRLCTFLIVTLTGFPLFSTYQFLVYKFLNTFIDGKRANFFCCFRHFRAVTVPIKLFSHRLVRVHHQDAHDAPTVRVPRRCRLSGVSLPALGLPCGCQSTRGKVSATAGNGGKNPSRVAAAAAAQKDAVEDPDALSPKAGV